MKYGKFKAPDFCWWLYLFVANVAACCGLRKMNSSDLILSPWNDQWFGVLHGTSLVSSVLLSHLFFLYVHWPVTKARVKNYCCLSSPTPLCAVLHLTQYQWLWNFKQWSIKFILNVWGFRERQNPCHISVPLVHSSVLWLLWNTELDFILDIWWSAETTIHEILLTPS